MNSEGDMSALSEEFRDSAGLLMVQLTMIIERIEQAGVKAGSHVTFNDFDSIISTMLALVVEIGKELNRLAERIDNGQ